MKACREDGVGRGAQEAGRNGAVSQRGRSQGGVSDGEAGSSAPDARLQILAALDRDSYDT